LVVDILSVVLNPLPLCAVFSGCGYVLSASVISMVGCRYICYGLWLCRCMTWKTRLPLQTGELQRLRTEYVLQLLCC